MKNNTRLAQLPQSESGPHKETTRASVTCSHRATENQAFNLHTVYRREKKWPDGDIAADPEVNVALMRLCNASAKKRQLEQGSIHQPVNRSYLCASCVAKAQAHLRESSWSFRVNVSRRTPESHLLQITFLTFLSFVGVSMIHMPLDICHG